MLKRGRGFRSLLNKSFKNVKTKSVITCLGVVLYVRFPLLLRNVENLLREPGLQVSHEPSRSG